MVTKFTAWMLAFDLPSLLRFITKLISELFIQYYIMQDIEIYVVGIYRHVEFYTTHWLFAFKHSNIYLHQAYRQPTSNLYITYL